MKVPWEERPFWQRAAGTRAGEIAIAALAGLMLVPTMGRLGWLVGALLLAANWRPERRRAGFSLLAATLCALSLWRSWWLLLVVALYVGGMWLWSRYLVALPHPLALLHGGALASIGLLWAFRQAGWPHAGAAIALTTLAPELIWRGSYWIRWRLREKGPERARENLFTLIPFVGRGGTPYGKGPEYLARYEARGSRELAASRGQGLHLLALALVWQALIVALQRLLYSGSAAPLPGMDALLRDPGLFELWQRWAGVFAELFLAILALAAYGHSIVAIYCLAGFRIPRNTQAPLFATTLLDFWSRYYFYFKELLMDFFFFPVYFRAVGLPLLARTLLATAAAAFAGNLYFHLILYAPELMRGGQSRFGQYAAARLVYCGLLAASLCWSFTSALRRPKAVERPWPRRALAAAVVASFFAFLHIWSVAGESSVSERAEVVHSLFRGW